MCHPKCLFTAVKIQHGFFDDRHFPWGNFWPSNGRSLPIMGFDLQRFMKILRMDPSGDPTNEGWISWTTLWICLYLFFEKKMVACSIPIIPECFFQQHGSMDVCSQKTVGSFTKRQKNFHYVLDRLGRGRHGRGYLSHLSCCNGKRCLQRYGWCDMAEEMVAIEDNVDRWGLLKNPEPVEFAQYIRDHFPSSSLEKEIDLPMFILGTFATSLCNINHPRHVPAKFTTSNLKIPQRDAWPTYWNYTLLGRY